MDQRFRLKPFERVLISFIAVVAAQAGLAVSVVFCFHRPLLTRRMPRLSFFSTLVFKVVPCLSSPWHQWFFTFWWHLAAHSALEFLRSCLDFTYGPEPQDPSLFNKFSFVVALLFGVGRCEPPLHLPYSRLHFWVVLSWLDHIYFYCSLVCVDSGGLTSSFNWLAFYDAVFDLPVLWSIAISQWLAMFFPFCMSISFWEHSWEFNFYFLLYGISILVLDIVSRRGFIS